MSAFTKAERYIKQHQAEIKKLDRNIERAKEKLPLMEEKFGELFLAVEKGADDRIIEIKRLDMTTVQVRYAKGHRYTANQARSILQGITSLKFGEMRSLSGRIHEGIWEFGLTLTHISKLSG